ncbi:MAG: hypothetical protein AAF449_02885 [Myxococcota bacterium]
MNTINRERVAIHEVGHALIAVLLGRAVTRVQLEPEPHTSLKRKRILPKGRPKTASERAVLEGELMLAVAGIAAERVMQVEDRQSVVGALDDLQKASRLALQIAGAARAEATVAHCLATTERMLRRRSETLGNAVVALMERGALNADDVATLIPRQ